MATLLHVFIMNFPHVRHYQRYEYVVQAGYVDNKLVADLGCGTVGAGDFLLSSRARFVFAVDTDIVPGKAFGFNGDARPGRLLIIPGNLFDFSIKVDVVVGIEVFEHMKDASKYISHVASLGNYAFLTTPLVAHTKKTRNPEHVLEYSAKDFDKIVEKKFEIVDKVYQHADMSITEEAEPIGDSFSWDHMFKWFGVGGRMGDKSGYVQQLVIDPLEKTVMDQVADSYKLTDEQRSLLYTVRQVEKGGPGREFGVLNKEAMRYKDNPQMSFITQAKWATGTIRDRYTGDLEAFSKRWAPIGVANDPTNLNKNWLGMLNTIWTYLKE